MATYELSYAKEIVTIKKRYSFDTMIIVQVRFTLVRTPHEFVT